GRGLGSRRGRGGAWGGVRSGSSSTWESTVFGKQGPEVRILSPRPIFCSTVRGPVGPADQDRRSAYRTFFFWQIVTFQTGRTRLGILCVADAPVTISVFKPFTSSGLISADRAWTHDIGGGPKPCR